MNFNFGWIKSLGKWILSVYSESDGSGSSTRVHMAAVIAFVLGIGVSFAVSVHHKYITLEQFDGFLSAGATFITVICGVLYGLNKTSSAVELKLSSPTPSTDSGTPATTPDAPTAPTTDTTTLDAPKQG